MARSSQLTSVFGGHSIAEEYSGLETMIDLGDPRTPTWPELQLDGHVKRLQLSLIFYFATLILFWSRVAGVVALPGSLVLPFMAGALLNYIFLVWTAHKIQQVLYESGLRKHGSWHVWIGALILNPVALGWYIPVSVMASAYTMRRQLEARWPNGRVD
jgi:hypothetical protein